MGEEKLPINFIFVYTFTVNSALNIFHAILSSPPYFYDYMQLAYHYMQCINCMSLTVYEFLINTHKCT
jgi:hypothetical protein